MRRRRVHILVTDSFYNLLERNRKIAEAELQKNSVPNYKLSMPNFTGMLSKYNYNKVPVVKNNKLKLPRFNFNIIKYEIKKGRLK